MLITTNPKFDELSVKQLPVLITDHELEVVRVNKLLGVNTKHNQKVPYTQCY